jgi:hypothetical protein
MKYRGIDPNNINEVSQSVVAIYAGGDEKILISGSSTVFNTDVTGSFTGSFAGDGSQLNNVPIEALSANIIENAFQLDANGDLMPTDEQQFLSVFYDYDENFDIMPRL